MFQRKSRGIGGSSALLLGFVLALPALSFAGSPTAEVCRTPALAINDNSTSTDTLTFAADLEIQDTQVFVDASHTWIGDLTISITSPAATSVTLHNGQGGSANNILVSYIDSGIGNGAPYTCNCDMQPSSGTLATLNGESSQGTWTFTVSDSATQDQGTVNEWCVGITGAPIDNFIRGDADGSGSVVGLVDGVFLLNYQFVIGSQTPPCMEAADVDNNGSFSGLLDAAYLLNFNFVTGSPPPPAPYPACGSDDDDALGCLAPPALCN